MRIQVYRSNAQGLRMCADPVSETSRIGSGTMHLFKVYPDITYQEFKGFGGALTQASANVFELMPEPARCEILKHLFDAEHGLGYTCARLPIGACDFSGGNYSYCDRQNAFPDDFSMERDRPMITLVNRARQICPDLWILASPWSPPAWMKTNGDMCHGGRLKPECRDFWAQYLLLYLRACAAEGIRVNCLTLQNEPHAVQTWESCCYTAEEEADFLKHHLLPTLENSEFREIGLAIWDHNKDEVFERAREIFRDAELRGKISGIAFHWYSGDHFENVALCRDFFPEKELLFTEGCVELRAKNTTMSEKAEQAGRSQDAQSSPWDYAEFYAHDIIGNLLSGMTRSIDWNAVLDERGGPNHVGNYCSAPIICNPGTGEIFLQPSYWAIAHFSRFITPGSKRIALSRCRSEIESVAFLRPDGKIVLTAMNPTGHDVPLTLEICGVQTVDADVCVCARSIVTCVLDGV